MTVFHGLANTLGPFLAFHPSVTGDPPSAYATAGVNLALAVIVSLVHGRSVNARRPA